MESKRERFVRLAEARTNKIIDMIQLLGNCSNQSQYEYTQKDVNKIFNTIQAELDAAKKRYRMGKIVCFYIKKCERKRKIF